jgi:hypothetical protein
MTVHQTIVEEGEVMCEVHFHFLTSKGTANGCTAEASKAAAILANCLSRQGCSGETAENLVVANLPTERGDEPENVFVVLDDGALHSLGQFEQNGSRSAVIVCSARPAHMLQKELGGFNATITTVDAEGIAMDEGSDSMVAVLGGAARMVSCLDPEALFAAVWSTYDRGLPYAAQAAMRTFDLGYMQAQQAPTGFAQ